MSTRATNLRTLDLNLLKVFDLVMEERNVTRAAARLSMTQPAVSNALRRLREATNEELFTPTSSGMSPTAHAEALWPTVRAALDNLQRAFEPQPFDPRTDARSFTLAMADATAALFVPTLVRRLQREVLQVDLRIVPLTSRDPREMLEHGRADIAVGFFPDVTAALEADDSGVTRRTTLYASGYMGVMRRGHPLAAPGALSLDAYCDAQHLRVSFAGRPHGFVDEALSRLGRKRRVMITVNSFFSASSAVHQSDLITVLPRGFVPITGFADALVSVPLPFALPAIDISAVWHARHEHDAAQRWLRDALARAIAEIRLEPDQEAIDRLPDSEVDPAAPRAGPPT